MLLTSYHFVAFFAVVVIAYFIIPFRYRWVLLLAASYYFYIAGSKPEYILVILITTAVSYYCGIRMGERETRREKRPYLVLSIVVSLGFLLL